MRPGLQAREPGAHLEAFMSKSIESNKEMKQFRDEVPNEAWEVKIPHWVRHMSLARPLSIKYNVWVLELPAGSTPVVKINVLGT